jgi:hypothetical protein
LVERDRVAGDVEVEQVGELVAEGVAEKPIRFGGVV